MGLIGSVLGGVTSAVGGIFAGNAAAKGYREQQKMYQDRLNEIKTHMNKKYYEDPTQNADNQAARTQAQEILNEQTQRANDSAVVTGATPGAVALQKQAAAATMGNILQQQAAAGAANRENLRQNAEGRIDAMAGYIANSKAAQAQAKANAITAASGALADAAGGLDFGGQIGKTKMTW